MKNSKIMPISGNCGTKTGTKNYKSLIFNLEKALVGTSKAQVHVPWILNRAERQLIIKIFWILCQPQRLTQSQFKAICGTKLTQRIR